MLLVSSSSLRKLFLLYKVYSSLCTVCYNKLLFSARGTPQYFYGLVGPGEKEKPCVNSYAHSVSWVSINPTNTLSRDRF